MIHTFLVVTVKKKPRCR